LKQKKKLWVAILLALYLLILVWMILFKGSIHTLQVLFLPEFRSIKLVPAMNARETLLNFLAFAPIGVYLGMLLKDKEKTSAWFKPVLFVFLLSLFFEVAQYILALGTSDITDLVSNTLGGMVGFAFYRAIRKRTDEKTDKIFIILGSIGTVLLLAFLVVREIWPEVLEASLYQPGSH